MSMLKPTIVFVHGAWHLPHSYSPLTSALETAGYTVSAPVLPSVGGKQKDFSEDVAAVREAIKNATEAGNDVVVLMHSYGGVCGSEAVEGFTRLDRESGSESGSVVRLIYLAAIIRPEKKTITSLGADMSAYCEPSQDGLQLNPINCHDTFYSGVDKDAADKIISELKPQAKGVYDSKVTYAAWKHVQSVYVVCEEDKVIPAETQTEMATLHGNKITVEKLNAGHSPWLVDLDGTVKVVRKAIGEQV